MNDSFYRLPEAEAFADWAAWLEEHARTGVSVYAYFNNDVGGHAPPNALALRRYSEIVEAVGATSIPGGFQ